MSNQFLGWYWMIVPFRYSLSRCVVYLRRCNTLMAQHFLYGPQVSPPPRQGG